MFADKTVSASTVEGPVIKDEEGNKIIQLCYDVKAFDPKDVKVVLQGERKSWRRKRKRRRGRNIVCCKRER